MDRKRGIPRIGSGGPAGTAAQVERAAAWRRPLGAARVRGRAMACIFVVVVGVVEREKRGGECGEVAEED